MKKITPLLIILALCIHTNNLHSETEETESSADFDDSDTITEEMEGNTDSDSSSTEAEEPESDPDSNDSSAEEEESESESDDPSSQTEETKPESSPEDLSLKELIKKAIDKLGASTTETDSSALQEEEDEELDESETPEEYEDEDTEASSLKEDDDNFKKLIRAINHWDLKKARFYISEKTINKKTKEGHTPLMVAAYIGHIGIVHRLLNQPGINIGLKNKKGKTALDIAIEKEKNKKLKKNRHTIIVKMIKNQQKANKKKKVTR